MRVVLLAAAVTVTPAFAARRALRPTRRRGSQAARSSRPTTSGTAGRPAPGRRRLGRCRPLDRARRARARRLRLGPVGGRPDRHPDHRRRPRHAALAGRLRVRGRERPRARIRSRPACASRAARPRTATGTRSSSTATAAGCTSSSRSDASTGAGRQARVRSGTCAPTACDRPGGRPPTPPDCPSSPVSPATTRSRAGASTMRFASPSTAPGAPTSGRHGTSRAT